MTGNLIEKLALIYVQAHADSSTSPKQLYEYFKQAEKEIQKADSDSFTPTP